MRPQRRWLQLLFGLMITAGIVQLAGHPARVSLAAPSACAPGPHHGTITADQTWCLVDSPHLVEGTVTIAPGVTLSLEPGVIVRAPGYPYEIGLVVQGQLQSIGTPAQPITLTSTDGGPTWAGLIVDGGSAALSYTTVEYACSDARKSNVAVISGGQLELADSILRECHYGGGAGERTLYINNGTATVTDSTFTASDQYPIYIIGPHSWVTLTGNSIQGNAYDRILLSSGAMMGHDTILSPQPVWDGYELEGTLTVPPTVTLTLEPGVIVRAPGYPYDIGLVVQGQLQSIGTPAQPITLTSTEGSPTWAGLIVDGGSATLSYTTVEYACSDARKSNVAVISGGQLELADSMLRECHYGGGAGEEMLWVENSQADVLRTTFRESDGEHIYVMGDSIARIADSSIEGASDVGLLVSGDQAFVQVSGSTILNNGTDGVRNTGASTVILSGEPEEANWIFFNAGYGANQTGLTGQILATYNWWGDASGPYHATANPAGTGESVSDRVIFDPWLTEATVPPSIDRYVWITGDHKVSVSGQYRSYAFYFANVGDGMLEDAILVADLPWETDYVSNSGGGIYWPLHHRVIWKLGDVPIGQSFVGVVQVYYKWGLPESHPMRLMGLVAAVDMPNPRVTYEAHLAYQGTAILTRHDMTEAEITTLLDTDDELSALYNHALSQGFVFFGYAVRRTLSDGSERVDMIMMDTDRPGELLYVRRLGEDRHIRLETESGVSVYDLEGGARFSFADSSWEFWGDQAEGTAAASSPAALIPPGATFPSLAAIQSTRTITSDCPALSEGDCLRNCLIQREPQKMTEGSLWGQSSCQQCLACDNPIGCVDVCTECAKDLWKEEKDDGDYRNRCTYQCRDVLTRQNFKCDGDLKDCYPAGRNSILNKAEYQRVYACNANCRYTPGIPVLEFCANGCDNTATLGGTAGISCCDPVSDWWGIQTCTAGSECPICDGVSCSPFPVVATVAHDPNALYGPEVAAPGQTIAYTIDTENVGEGIAYGVFAVGSLPAELDADTLVVGQGGIYYARSREIFWEIGTLAPAAGAQVTFSAVVPADTPVGTIINAGAEVHFPSVPEITPTNNALTLIGEVLAYPQEVAAVEGVARSFTLSGYTISGKPLSYQVLNEPVNGTLAGTPPSLTYTPDANFEGADSLSFRVLDGATASLPAQVLIRVATGQESVPPQVTFTSPNDGATGVGVYRLPLAGDVYDPLIWAQVTEPLDPATLTGATFYLEDSQGRSLLGEPTFHAEDNRLQFVLHEPLAWSQTYTVTLTTGIKDTSGNGLASEYQWSFTTQPGRVCLPLVIRR